MEAMQADYRRLWNTGRLSDITFTVTEYAFPNGTIGKIVTYTAGTIIAAAELGGPSGDTGSLWQRHRNRALSVLAVPCNQPVYSRVTPQ